MTPDGSGTVGRRGRYPGVAVLETCGDGWRVATDHGADSSAGRRPPAIMGILNVTPDSFSDGGRWNSQAVARGLEMAAQGADIIDVGGESTRPGALRVGESEEIDRVIPVVAALANSGVVVSVDTMRASVAREAAAAGARIVNDVSGGLADEEMAHVVADVGVLYVAMHWRGHSDRMADYAQYYDVVAEVGAELAERVDALNTAGIRRDALIVDPGLGFSKVGDDNWRLLAGLGHLTELGLPILVGASRKRFLGDLLDISDPSERDAATLAVSMVSANAGAWAVRVHEVSPTWEAFQVMQAYRSHIGPALD